MEQQTRVLEYARDVASQFALDKATNCKAQIRGIVIDRKNAGRAVFLEILDVSGVIQVLFLAEQFSTEDFATCKEMRRGDVVAVEGAIGENNAGRLTIFASVVPTLLGNGDTIPISAGDIAYQSAGSRMIHARIIGRLKSYLAEQRYLEIEPKYISAEWAGKGLEPLKVVYPGFGRQVYLTPSPLPQLFEVLISTGQPKVFAVGKCFSTSYRDGRHSTEATAIYCLFRHDDKGRKRGQFNIWDEAVLNLRQLFASVETFLPDAEKALGKIGDVPVVTGVWTTAAPEHDGLVVRRSIKPDIPVRREAVSESAFDSATVLEYARIEFYRAGQRYMFAECTAEQRFGTLDVITVTYHTEHILDVLSTAPFRSIRTATFWND